MKTPTVLFLFVMSMIVPAAAHAKTPASKGIVHQRGDVEDSYEAKISAARERIRGRLKAGRTKMDPAAVERYLDMVAPLIPNRHWEAAYAAENVLHNSVYNPVTQALEEKKSEPFQDYEGAHRADQNFSGVFNPITAEVEWKESTLIRNFDASVVAFLGRAGVFNPDTLEIEWRENKVFNTYNGYQGQVSQAGVYDPLARKVEWHEGDFWIGYYGQAFARHYRGFFDPATGAVAWTQSDIHPLW